MSIKIYNTIKRKKEALIPLEDNHVKLYVCGITSYDYCHIGHARSALVFDMVVRYLKFKGYKVTFIRNFTDIDDKIIARAGEQGVAADELAKCFIGEFYADMDALGVARPDVEPLATEHVQDMIDLIGELIGKGLAYPSGGDVYFRVERFAEYGKLSGRRLEDMQAGARVELNDKKENPLDFALWKGAKEGEPSWQSPWGAGRPGWHIECSAMSRKYFGDTFDIHGGGKDLIFPHHENELAQSCGVSGKPLASIWMHHGFVTIKDEKMSKSLGNFLTIRDVLQKYSPEALRLFIFSAQYRSPLDFTEDTLRECQAGVDRIYDSLSLLNSLESGRGDGGSVISNKDREKFAALPERFSQAMDNDFNTAQALGFIFDVVKVVNKVVRKLPDSPDSKDVELLQEVGTRIRELLAVLGLGQHDPVAYVLARKEKLLSQLPVSESEVERLVEERNRARDNKDWSRSDELRDRLLQMGIELHDSGGKTTWTVKG